MKTRFAFLICIGIAFSISLQSVSQTLSLDSWSVSAYGYGFADDQTITPAGVFDSDTFNTNVLVPNMWGYDYLLYKNITPEEETPYAVTSSQSLSYIYVDGDSTASMDIHWFFFADGFTNTYEGYAAHALNQSDADLSLVLLGSPGTQLIVYYKYWIYAAGHTDHEANDEDSVKSINTLFLDTIDLVENKFNFTDPPGIPGYNQVINKTGSLTLNVGDTISISFSADLYAEIEMPGKPYGFGHIVDQASTAFSGHIELSIGMQPPPDPQHTTAGTKTLFSLDIGSDTEISDPNSDGDEFFDPGDAYILSATTPVVPHNGILNDSSYFLSDPSPDPAIPLSAAPCGSTQSPYSLQHLYFDLDGFDNTNFDLSQLSYGPGMLSIPQFYEPCVFSSEHLFYSYDDDFGTHYADTNTVAVNCPSGVGAPAYGTTLGIDEVMACDISFFWPASVMLFYNLYKETDVSNVLAPNPDFFENTDDDVDGLDIIDSIVMCQHWYVSADHEALYRNPLNNQMLKPGSIYLVLPGSGLQEVISAVTHLGLTDSTDIDGFEFAWLFDNIEQRLGLALLFTVDDDDWMTIGDESGGHHPGMIYASFLDGSHFPLLAQPMYDDIDAIACYAHSFNGTLNPPMGIQHKEPLQNMGLFNIFPNPSSTHVMLEFTIQQKSHVEIQVFDMNGKLMKTLESKNYQEGIHRLNWNHELENGAYIVRLLRKTGNKLNQSTQILIIEN